LIKKIHLLPGMSTFAGHTGRILKKGAVLGGGISAGVRVDYEEKGAG
jgi:hypothetical protein